MLEHLNTNLNCAIEQTFFVQHSNLSGRELSALEWLRSLVRHRVVAIIKADKGGQWAVANFRDYCCAVKQFIISSGNYKAVPFNSKYKVAALIKRTVADFADIVDNETRTCLLAHTNQPKSRRFYGLPKIHKPKTV
jgi:hypothetical protein